MNIFLFGDFSLHSHTNFFAFLRMIFIEDPHQVRGTQISGLERTVRTYRPFTGGRSNLTFRRQLHINSIAGLRINELGNQIELKATDVG